MAQRRPILPGIFNLSQHEDNADQALTEIKNLYNSEEFSAFENVFMDCIKKLLQSDFSIYFKNTCDFICKFLKHVDNLDDNRLLRSCADLTHHYMQITDHNVRLKALCLFSQITNQLDSIDSEIINAFKGLLIKRMRDKKAAIRAQAFIASCAFQEEEIFRDCFLFHHSRDPDYLVRKTILQVTDVKVFGLDFLVGYARDTHEAIRRLAFIRLSKIEPKELSKQQLNTILHFGLSERDRHASFAFKTKTLSSWLPKMYDGLNLVKLLDSFDVINHANDIETLLNYIHQHDLDKVENKGAATKLHHVVEAFREKWLGNNCIPALKDCNERVIVVWLSLVKFCEKHQNCIKSIKIRTISATGSDPDQSIERILNNEEHNDEVIELYERLAPDLVNLINFLKHYIEHTYSQLTAGKLQIQQAEYVYQLLMSYIAIHEVKDTFERNTVLKVLCDILKENLLTEFFENFIPPIVRCLSSLIYSKRSHIMVNLISDLIQNIRSHFDDCNNAEIYRDHPYYLIQCFQMYYTCLEQAKISQVPQTMLNHLDMLCYVSLDEWFAMNCKKLHTRIWCLMLACNGITAFIDKNYAKFERTIAVFESGLLDENSQPEIRTISLKSIVDIVVQHEDIDYPLPKVEVYLKDQMQNYGYYNPETISKSELEFITAIVHATAKLYFYRKLESADLLSSAKNFFVTFGLREISRFIPV